MKLKICGVRTKAMFDFCESNGVDFMGFNFVPWSKRKVKDMSLLRLPAEKSQKVALFMDAEFETIQEILTLYPFDVVQFHGNESPLFLEKIKLKFPDIKIWKVFEIKESLEISQLQEYCKNGDTFLFDSKKPGTGTQILDIKKLQKAINFSLKLNMPCGLAGGINEQNVADFKQKFPKISFLDTASGVEKNGNFDITVAYKLLKNFGT